MSARSIVAVLPRTYGTVAHIHVLIGDDCVAILMTNIEVEINIMIVDKF